MSRVRCTSQSAHPALRAQAQEILARRRIFTPRALELTLQCETAGGLDAQQAAEFVREATQTFRWHGEATVSHDTHQQLLAAHRLIADVVNGQVDVRGIEVPEVAEAEVDASSPLQDEDTAEADDLLDADGEVEAGE